MASVPLTMSDELASLALACFFPVERVTATAMVAIAFTATETITVVFRFRLPLTDTGCWALVVVPTMTMPCSKEALLSMDMIMIVRH